MYEFYGQHVCLKCEKEEPRRRFQIPTFEEELTEAMEVLGIIRNSKSGLCLCCLRKRTKKKAKKKKEIKYCDCGKPLAPNNKNGVCIECWRKLPETQANRQKVQNWVNAAVFHKNATTRGSTDAP